MPDFHDQVVTIVGAASGVVSYLMYRLYRSRSEIARQVKGLPVWQVDEALEDHLLSAENQSIDYAVIEGIVRETGRAMQSHYGSEKGVLMQTSITEYKAKRTGGLWNETKEEIENDLHSVPFHIASDESGHFRINVTEPKEATNIVDDLEITYHRYEPNKNSFLKETFDRLYGEITKGVKVTERMLLCGSSVTGLGRIYIDRGQTKLGPPEDSKNPYIISTKTLSELVKQFESQSSTFKVFSVIFALLSGGLLLSIIWRNIKRWYIEYKQKAEFEELRKAHAKMKAEATQRAPEGTEGSERCAENPCVVCLENERQVIVLNCGHIALCTSCAEALPYPKKCPVCRGNIERLLPVFSP